MTTTSTDNLAAASGTFRHRRRPAGRPARLRRHAADRPGRVGAGRATTTRRSRVLRRAVELGIDLHRHRRLLRPVRTAEQLHPRGAAPVRRRRRHRDQGRPARDRRPDTGCPVGRPEYLRQQVRAQPAPPRPGAHRPVPAAPHRPDRAAGGPARRARRAAAGGQDPPHRPVRGRRRAAPGGPEGRAGSSRCRTSTTSPTAPPRPLLDHCEAEGIGFIPWFPLATGGAVEGRTARSADGGPRARRDAVAAWRWPGCCAARR